MEPASVVSEVSEGDWVSVNQAAVLTGVPVRTLHRWVKSGAVRGRIDGKRRQVLLSEVQGLAANRATATVPVVPGAVPARAPVANTMAHTSDGELAARVFGLLDDGVAPAQVVREERLAPNVVLSLTDQWARLKAAGKPGDTPLPDQVRSLRKEVEGLREQLRYALEEGLPATLGAINEQEARHHREGTTAFQALAQRLQAVEQYVAALGHAVLRQGRR